MENIDEILTELVSEINILEDRYLKKYFPTKPEHTPDVFEYDVKAFCVLSHACFEEFIEQISESIMDEVVQGFLGKKISLSTAMFLMVYSDRMDIDVDEKKELDTCFDIIRKNLDKCKEKHSRNIRENHGFSKKYLRNMLVPVGVNVRFDPAQESAIAKLTEARGSFAHSRSKQAYYGGYKSANKLLSPDEAVDISMDCLKACESIAGNVKIISQ